MAQALCCLVNASSLDCGGVVEVGNGDVLVKNTLGFGKWLLAEEKIKKWGPTLAEQRSPRKRLVQKKVYFKEGTGRCSFAELNLGPAKLWDGGVPVSNPQVSTLPAASKHRQGSHSFS